MERQFPARNNRRKTGVTLPQCRQLDSDTGDALAHLALDWHAAQAPVRATEAGRRLDAGDPGAVQAVLCGSKPSDCRGVGALTPRAHFPLA